MGSEGERFARIAHSIRRIGEQAGVLDNSSELRRLKRFCSRLWYAFLGQSSDNSFWLLGPSLDRDTLDGESLAGVAFAAHRPHQNDVIDDEDLEAGARRAGGLVAYLSIALDMIDVDQFLPPVERAVMLIFLNTEAIAYAVCRHHDDWMRSLRPLNRAIRDIQGECFGLFADNEVYARAWMLAQLCKKILTYDEDDLVNQWWMKDDMHHLMNTDLEFDTIFALFCEWQFHAKPSVQERLALTLQLAGGNYHHTHEHTGLLSLVDQHNRQAGEDRVDREAVVLLLDGCARRHAATERSRSKEDDKYCWFTGKYGGATQAEAGEAVAEAEDGTASGEAVPAVTENDCTVNRPAGPPGPAPAGGSG